MLIESFRSARESGDLERARSMLSDNPRVWYDSKEGEGRQWTIGAGRYKAWDKHFSSVSTPSKWHTDPGSVWRINDEWNEYYDLIERTNRSRYRITYFHDPMTITDPKIIGYMISAADPNAPKQPKKARTDRFDEIAAWATANDPDEWEYIRPGGKLDPTGDRAVRTRALINRWRTSVGLKPIEYNQP